MHGKNKKNLLLQENFEDDQTYFRARINFFGSRKFGFVLEILCSFKNFFRP